MLILTVLQGPDKGRRFELPDNEPQMIGRSSESLPLSDHTISRRHSELTPDEGAWFVRDLNSANGTYVNGTRVEGRRRLEPGDQVRAGNTLIVFGREGKVYPDYDQIRVAREGELSVNVEHVVSSPDDSMVLAVPEPTEAAVLQLKVIYELTQLIGSTIDQGELLEKIMDVIFEHFQADRGFILLFTGDEEFPVPVVVRHRVKPTDKEASQITVSKTIVQHVLHKREGVLSSNAMSDPRFAAGDSVRDYGIRSAMCVPVKYKDELFGVINLDSKIANYTFTEDQLRLLTAIGVETGLAVANVRLYGEQLKAERLAAVGQTVASLSHSIKNILQGMRGGADVCELGLAKGKLDVVGNGWEIVSRNLDRIMGLTLNMLAYSKQRKPELEMVNLNHLIEEIMQLVERQFDSKSAALIAELDPDMPPVPIDPSGVHQAVLNLLNNGLDAAPADTGVVTVRTHYDNDEQQVAIRITDNGEGISDAETIRLFEPFYSTKGLKGTGLGLVVSKKIAEEHGGSIEVESRPNEGTTFTLTFPTNRAAVPHSADTSIPAINISDESDMSFSG